MPQPAGRWTYYVVEYPDGSVGRMKFRADDLSTFELGRAIARAMPQARECTLEEYQAARERMDAEERDGGRAVKEKSVYVAARSLKSLCRRLMKGFEG